MKIGICDDIGADRARTEAICRSLGYSDLYLYSSGEELLQSPDLPSLTLLFLDIKMNGISGIEVKNKLELAVPFTFIAFCTIHQDNIRNAFGRNVIFFLPKPLTENEVTKAINKAALLSKNFFPIKITDSHTILCQDVLYLKAEHKYTIFHTADGKALSSRKPLKEWADTLKNLGFCPISRGVVINLYYYQRQEKQRIYLYDGSSFTISRLYIQALKDANDSYAIHMAGLAK